MNDYKKFKLENIKRALANQELKIRAKLSQFCDYESLIKLVKKISKGNKGDIGYSPIKGKDYFTKKEVDDFKKEITPKKGKDYKDGKSIKGDSGYTPQKDIDYFDGDDGKTPKKGIDYFTDEEKLEFLKKITPEKEKDYFTEKEIIWFLEKITPIKGTDYFTKEELEKIKKEITPIKNKDYFDGKSIKGDRGYTPVKGKDYFDGKGIDEDKLLLTILERLEGKIDEDLTEQEKRVLEQLEVKLGEMVQRLQGRSGGIGRQDVLDIISGNQPHTIRDDLSSQCDGSNMVFNLSKVGMAGTFVLQGTQFPIIYRPGVDYNVAPDLKTVTLVASEVGAPKKFQTLVMHYEEIID